MENRFLNVSVNPDIINKNIHQNPLDKGFKHYELSLEELAEVIGRGAAFSYVFTDEHRKKYNFVMSDILVVDVDHGLTIEEAFDHPIFQQYCSIFYRTVSHTPDDHRFRLVFVLPRTITNPDELVAATRSLSQRFGGDPAATDAARLFYGNSESTPQIFDRQISEDFLKELIADGRHESANESIAFKGNTSSRSDHKIRPDLLIRTIDGNEIPVSEITKNTSIYCPYHQDKNPSAFVNITTHGSHYIHCKSCQKTWWLNNDAKTDYDFDSFETALRRAKGFRRELKEDEKSPLDFVFGDDDIKVNNIHISSDEHLRVGKLEDGLTLIKSPKGSGKTKFLSDAIPEAFQRFKSLEDYESACDSERGYEPPLYSDHKVLLIGHRQALIGELCQRLQLNCYLDDHNSRQALNRYGVCLDSLWKVRGRQYDTIVIDESEQVISHFLGSVLNFV